MPHQWCWSDAAERHREILTLLTILGAYIAGLVTSAVARNPKPSA